MKFNKKYVEVVKTQLSDVVLFNQSTKDVFVIPLWELERVIAELDEIVIRRKNDKSDPSKKAGVDYV